MTIKEFTAKTTEEAISEGLRTLGCTLSDVKVEVLEEGSKGLFGLFGSRPARVRLTVLTETDEKDDMSDLLSSFSLNPQRAARPPRPAQPKPTPKAEPVKSEASQVANVQPVPDVQPRTEAARPAERPAAPAPEKKDAPQKKAAVPAPQKKDAPSRKAAPAAPAEKPAEAAAVYAPIPERVIPDLPDEPPVMHDAATPMGRAQQFLMEVTRRMNVPVQVYVDTLEDGTIYVRMVGDTLGILIGRRGETLDALQYLTSLQVNRDSEDYLRVTLDTENYRARREDSLCRLATRMAQKAVKTGRKVVLEPMNPYERRVLHAALQNHPSVTTHSEGDEPNRHVVITLKSAAPDRSDAADKAPRAGRPPRKRGSRGRGPKKPDASQTAVAAQASDVPAPDMPAETVAVEDSALS